MLSPQPRSISEAIDYVEAALTNPLRIAFAVLDARSGAVRGTSSFWELDQAQGGVEIGHTFYGRQYWGGATNPSCKLLMLQQAFDVWGLHRVALRCDSRNLRSTAAIARLGAVREGVLRGHRLAADGARSDTVVFSLLAHEWPQARRRLQQRLDAPADEGRA